MNKPSDITETDNFWHLLPNVTPDTELRKALKSNFTVAKIVQEWRHKWQTSNRWTLAEIEELIRDMKNDEANVRFQAVVISNGSYYFSYLIRSSNFSQKHPKKYKSEELGEEFKDLYKQRSELTFGKASSLNQKQQMYLNDIIFSEKLFETIENLLNDSNFKVKLAAAIGIFVIMKKFARPYTQKYQLCKDKAERVLRDAMKTLGTTDKYTAALCLGKDGFIDETIIGILLTNYFESNEQYTKEQVTQCLSDLSSHNQIVHRKIEAHLESEHVRERILTCKLIPCLKTALTKKIVAKLMDLMWNDVNHNVKKVAAQTLGRTGRGKEVHDQLFRKLHSVNLFERISALKIINHIGIMTQKLLEVFLKCFRDDYMSIRQMACVCCQRLFEKDEKIIDALVFVARFDPVSKLKALAIRSE
ncbi:HEAT repeat-containing 4 isoform X1 [Brachionus plicatilis]|uniref:HEAT repeat-containing 4 isoform X1 n=1 Tax=Brachionus plicatilis TaxID=10195 RepID=A0A3M7SWD5_BRAPC|nr:HEAT repeat-containing 4 isoform X1 [Brachionus plicatilis]